MTGTVIWILFIISDSYKQNSECRNLRKLNFVSDWFGPEFHLTRQISGRGALNFTNITTSYLPHWHFKIQLLLFLTPPIFKYLHIFSLAQGEKIRVLSQEGLWPGTKRYHPQGKLNENATSIETWYQKQEEWGSCWMTNYMWKQY